MSFFNEAIKSVGNKFTPEFNIIHLGGNALYVDGFRKITKISDEKIVLLCARKIIEISGELNIEGLEQNAITLTGKITGVTINDL